MRPRIGHIVQVRAGAYCVQERCAAIVTKVHGDTIVDLTVFPGEGVGPFTLRSVKRAADGYRELSNKETFWQPPDA